MQRFGPAHEGRGVMAFRLHTSLMFADIVPLAVNSSIKLTIHMCARLSNLEQHAAQPGSLPPCSWFNLQLDVLRDIKNRIMRMRGTNQRSATSPLPRASPR